MKEKNHSITSKQRIGHWGEDLAAKYIREAGYEVLERNVRTPEGEIDLVVCKGNEIRFVEVKTRTSTSYGYPEEAVETVKLDHMQAAAENYLDTHVEFQEDWHLDVLAIIGKPGHTEIEFNWIKDADL